jgi:hypothetical protein
MGEGVMPADPGTGQATTADRWGSDEGTFRLGQPVEPSPLEAAEIERITRAARRAAPRPWHDPADWRGEYEADPDRGLNEWAAIRTRPTAKEAAELRRRHSPPELLDMVEQPNLWNLAIGAMRAGSVLTEMHRNSLSLPPDKPPAYFRAIMLREAEAVLRAPLQDRSALIRRARQSLERFILQGLAGAEIDAFIARLESCYE